MRTASGRVIKPMVTAGLRLLTKQQQWEWFVGDLAVAKTRSRPAARLPKKEELLPSNNNDDVVRCHKICVSVNYYVL